MTIPELEGTERLRFARPGFNVLATANIRNRGVHEMSSAQAAVNLETVHPIGDLAAGKLDARHDVLLMARYPFAPVISWSGPSGNRGRGRRVSVHGSLLGVSTIPGPSAPDGLTPLVELRTPVAAPRRVLGMAVVE